MKASLKRWVGRVPDLSAVVSRFPVAVAAMVIFTAMLIFILMTGSTVRENIDRLMLGLVISAFGSVIITIAQEGRKKPTLIPLQIACVLMLAALFWFSETLRLNFVMAVGAVLLLLGNAVRVRRSRDDLHIWDFTHKIWTGAGFAVLGSIIFTVGILAIQAALKSLFGLRINDLTEHFLLPIGLGFLAPLYWLSTVPAVDEPYEELIDNPGFVSKAVAFLGTWLLSPLTLIYAAILLAYAVKILLAGALPKGEIAQLTTPFLLVGTLTWLVLEPPFIKTKALAKLFRKFWFPVSIPAALMLAIAVFVRVNEYGFTPERVALCLIVLWVLGLGFWFSIGPKAKRDIRFIPGTASAFLFIGTIASGWVSIGSQYNRLDASLGQALTKTNGQFEVADNEAAQTAKSAINYLKGKKANKALIRAFSQIDYQPKTNFSLTDVYDDLGLEDVKLPSRYSDNQAKTYQYGNKPLNLEGFDQILGQYNYHFYSRNKKLNQHELYNHGGIKFLIEDGHLEVWKDDAKLTDYNLYDWAGKRRAETIESNLEEPINIYDEGDLKISIQPKMLHIWNNGSVEDTGENSELFNGNMEFYILLNGFKL